MAVSMNPFMEITKLFKMIGEFINSVFKNDYALLAVLLTIVTILFKNILQRLLSRIPIFAGEGGETNAQGSTIAWCVSLLAVVSIGYTTRGNVTKLVKAFAGPWGSFLVIALAVLMGYFVHSLFEGWHQTARIGFGLLAGALTATWLISYIHTNTAGMSWGYAVLAILGLIIIGITHLFRR